MTDQMIATLVADQELRERMERVRNEQLVDQARRAAFFGGRK